MEGNLIKQLNAYYERVLDGHVFIRESIDGFIDTVARYIRRLGRPARVLELGNHTGVNAARLLALCPDAEIVLCDENAELIPIAQQRLAGQHVEFLTKLPEKPERPFDIVISVARHHHLPHDYLAGVHGVLAPGGVYIVGDELCPEYCYGSHAERIARAELLHIIGGYVLTSPAEVEAYQRRLELPPEALALERLRQRALWRWYRFVVDWAMERGYVDIAVSELQSTHDDLITGSDAEHKFGPLIVERQFALAGFTLEHKQLFGPEDDPEKQSMYIFIFGKTPASKS